MPKMLQIDGVRDAGRSIGFVGSIVSDKGVVKEAGPAERLLHQWREELLVARRHTRDVHGRHAEVPDRATQQAALGFLTAGGAYRIRQLGAASEIASTLLENTTTLLAQANIVVRQSLRVVVCVAAASLADVGCVTPMLVSPFYAIDQGPGLRLHLVHERVELRLRNLTGSVGNTTSNSNSARARAREREREREREKAAGGLT
eukprot:COSAG02_NODE_1231_length_13766_cov_16.546572_10_plen_203_part_00